MIKNPENPENPEKPASAPENINGAVHRPARYPEKTASVVFFEVENAPVEPARGLKKALLVESVVKTVSVVAVTTATLVLFWKIIKSGAFK
jgi:hypothetical protein